MQKLFKTKKGFTLIEILIVVAIIGILATIVVVSMREASDRSKSTKIISAIVQVRRIADDLYVQTTNGYVALCDGTGLDITNNADLEIINDDVVEYGSSITCYAGSYHFCVSAILIGENAQYFCIDDSGTNVRATVNPCDDGLSCQP